MKNVRIYCWLLLLPFLAQTAKAYLDIPLNWKIQEWQFVVIAQAGEQRTNNEGVYVEKKVVKILRGNETDLPKFEWWQNNDIKNGQYYLLTYQFPRWEQRFNVEATNTTFLVKAIQDNQPHGFSNDFGIPYRDLSLNEFQKLLENIPYESNPTNRFLYKYVHANKPTFLTAEQATSLARQLANEKAAAMTVVKVYGNSTAHFVSGHWVWIGSVHMGSGVVDFTVELAADGSTNSVGETISRGLP